MTEKVRAKFKITKVSEVDWSPTIRLLTLSAVSDDGLPENQRFHKFTPAGTVEIMVDNPSIDGFFKIGTHYYLDFIPCIPENK
ncbi:MAG: hypothetical protein ACYDHY_06730 [Acidiferrobacterales bacterium]